MMAAKKDVSLQKTTKSLQRAISLLHVLAERSEIGLSDLARATHLPKPTVHRLLLTLSRAQLASFEPSSERYRLGPCILAWADKMVSADDLRVRSRPILDRLRRETDESVGLVERHQNDSVCLMAVHSVHELRVVVRVGAPRPLFIGAPGKALMAYLPEDEIRRVLQAAPQAGPHLPTLLKQLRTIRAQGFARSTGESVPGIYSLAVPILDAAGRPHASIALYVPESRVTATRERHWATLFKKAATELQSAIIRSGRSVPSDTSVAA